MATPPNSNPTTLELTETETKLRQLLLDVAAYIDDTAGPGAIESAVKVPDELTKEKIVLRFTGGWVRDKLLGVGSNDIDVAINKMTGEHFGLKTLEYLKIPGNPAKYGMEEIQDEPEKPKPKERKSGKPAKVAKPVNLEKSRKIAPGMHKIQANPEKSKNLETTTTTIMGIDLDLVNLRKETYNEVSRNPEIEFGTPEEDAMRRDATVNAMFYNLNTSQIEDFTGLGFKDMEAKILRTPLEPYQTFKDDPLRVLRLIRFASRLNYKIDPETENAMSNEKIGQVLKIKISRERVGIEFEKMLKGPDPLMALQLIDRLGLYGTIFTDPTKDMGSAPDVAYFSAAYKFVASLSSPDASDIPAVIPGTVVRNPEEKYLAWVCASVMPWADAPNVPHPKPAQRPYYAAYLVAREGFKAPNRISDVVADSLRYGEEIRQIIDQCYHQIKRPNTTKAINDTTTRDALGMAIRRWGPHWRTQVLFSLIYEIVLGSISRERILESYAIFLDRVTTFDILEAYTFKPLVTGTDLAKALNTKPGPWMKDALDVVMAWQLRNPSITDPAAAIEAVKSTKHSELSSALASHFLTLTVRPLFSQTKPNPNLTPAGHKAPSRDQKTRFPDTNEEAWKDGKNSTAIELLRWTLSSLDAKGVEANWGLLVPPILRMMDDVSTQWKATGAELLTLLLKSTPPSLLARTGLGDVFEDSLMPLFTFLPTMTPEGESAALLEKSFPALMALADVMYPPSPSPPSSPAPSSRAVGALLTTPREKYLDKLLRDGILAPLFHASPASYPRLATTLLTHLSPLLYAMRIDAVKHLQPLTALLSDILAEPLVLSHTPLVLASATGVQSLLANCWPRVHVHRGEVLRGLCFAWVRCCEEEVENGKASVEVEQVKEELKVCVCMLREAVVCAAGLTEQMERVWEDEKRELVRADGRLEGLFGGDKE